MSFHRKYKTPYTSHNKTKPRYTLNETLPSISPSPSSESAPVHSFMINLEDLLILESHFSFILDRFNIHNQILSTLEEIWDMTAENTLNNLSSLYREEKTRDAIKYSMVLQAVGVSLSHYFISEYSLNPSMSQILKSILFSIHQAFLIITKFVLSRVPSDNKNQWANRLREIIKEKKLRKHHIDDASYLEHYNSLIGNNLRKLCRDFIGNSEDEVVKALKMALMHIVRTKSISIQEARVLVETAFGVKREPGEKCEKNEKFPFLPEGQKEYTLVLDLDETLVHYIDSQSQGKFLTRPYVHEFLQNMSKHFEIVIFTAAIKTYADWILDELDKSSLISHRLYRNHTIPAGNYFIKDLKQLGRDLAKTIIVDNVSENFQLQNENGILIKSWYEDPSDTALLELSPFLETISINKIPDVRDYLKESRLRMLQGSGMSTLS